MTAIAERGTAAEAAELEAERNRRILDAEPRNLLVLGISTAIIRVGWIFKVESVLIPAFLDSIAGMGWLRGLLPVINRSAQSLPSFLLARRVKLVPRKRWVLFFGTFGMAAPFLVLAGGLEVLGAEPRPGYALAFLVLYGLFFASTGIHMLALGTLSGKLVQPQRRGRLLTLGTLGGSLPAVALALWLLPGWLAAGQAGWSWIFGFAGLCFAAAAIAALFLHEPPDAWEDPPVPVAQQFAAALRILRDDRDFRLLVIVSAMITTTLMLIPHYQALGRTELGLVGTDLMAWVVTQTLATGAASAVAGPLADRYGNRLTLRLVAMVGACVPGVALLIAGLGPERGGPLFIVVFAMLGMTPLAFRVTGNYLLELAPEEEHTRYLSISQVCNAAVILLSPLVGLVIDRVGFAPAFMTVASVLALAVVLTFRLREPRFS